METIMKYFPALLLILLGFLVVKYPMLIAGYNTMPKKDREKIDIDRLSRFMRNCLVGMGLALMIGTFLFPKLGWQEQLNTYSLVVVIGGCLLIVVFGNIRYAKGVSVGKGSIGKQSKVVWWITGIITGVIFISIAFTLLPAGIEIEKDDLKITGAYPVSLSWQHIDSLEIRESLPTIQMRTNGASLGKWHKGYYKTEKWGKARLYLQSKEGPFLVIYSSTEPVIVLNRKDKETLDALYKQIWEKTSLN